MSIQPWSIEGSNLKAVPRPWTGIVRGKNGERFLVYCEAARRDEANALLRARAEGGELVAAIFGHHEPRVLSVM